jgi:hypothetical protein
VIPIIPALFVFQVPPGWTQLSQDEAQKVEASFLARDAEGSAYVMANVQPGATAVTEEVLEQASNAKDKRLLDWDGVTVGRITDEARADDGKTVGRIIFLIPGDGEHAVLTYATAPDRLATYEKIFDNAARATKGMIQPPSFWQRILRGQGRGALLGFIGAAIALLVLRRIRTRPAT